MWKTTISKNNRCFPHTKHCFPDLIAKDIKPNNYYLHNKYKLSIHCSIVDIIFFKGSTMPTYHASLVYMSSKAKEFKILVTIVQQSFWSSSNTKVLHRNNWHDTVFNFYDITIFMLSPCGKRWKRNLFSTKINNNTNWNFIIQNQWSSIFLSEFLINYTICLFQQRLHTVISVTSDSHDSEDQHDEMNFPFSNKRKWNILVCMK